VSEINAAIGGTGSDLGVYRLQQDVLAHRPDLLFIEFAVNDGGTPPESIYRSMEGIVRQTWKADPATDICFVYTITEALAKPLYEGKFPRAASAMERIADPYGIPSIHMALEVARLAKEGKLVWAAPKPKTDEEKKALEGKVLFAGDGVHPYAETGHELYLAAVVRSVEKIRSVGKAGPHELPKPFVADNWQDAKLVPLEKVKPGDGWEKLDPARAPLAKAFGGRLGALWKAARPGAALAFRFKGTAAALYDLMGPDCGQVVVTLDDKPPRLVPRFDRYSAYHRLATLSIASGLPEGVHTVKLELHAEPPDKVKIFKDGNITSEDPKAHPKYAGANWYAGAVLLVGELVEPPPKP
jgi:lysophospholipase L1-like esterase